MKRIVCMGGGPAGLYYGLLHKKNNPEDEVTIIDRNLPNSTFGWGVVFSDVTMQNLYKVDEKSAQIINDALNHWEDIECFFQGEKHRSTGHGFIGIGRLKLLNILQERAAELGVTLVYDKKFTNDEDIVKEYNPDLIIAADGLNSIVREKYEDDFDVDIDMRSCRFTWLGTHKLFDAFTFIFEKTKFGWMSVHAYKFDENTSTFIVEMKEEDWYKAGLDKMSQEEAIAFCEDVFKDYLDSNKLMTNAKHLRGSANWIKFPRIICNKWNTYKQYGDKKIPLVLMGDSSHTAHFSIGSGTKLALEDAICFNRLYVECEGNLEKVFEKYEKERRIEVARIKNSARNSTWWFEQVKLHEELDPLVYYYSMLTRSQRISHENLYLRDKKFITNFENKLTNGKLPVEDNLTISNIKLENRYVLDSNVSQKQLNTGAGLILSSAFDVSSQIDISKDYDIKALQESGSKIAITLTATQNKSNDDIILDFEKNAIISEKDGADFISIDCASNVLGKLVNDSDYVLAIKVINRLQNAVKIPLMIKINASNWDTDVADIGDVISFVKELKKANINLVIVSSGAYSDKNMDKRSLGRVYNGCFSDEIKNSLNISVICTGNISSLDEANSLIAAARADLVAIDHKTITNNSFKEQVTLIRENRNLIKE